MGTFTSRLNLFKPSGTSGSADAVDVAADLNAQYDIIDAAMGFQALGSFPGSPYDGKGVRRTDQAGNPFYVWNASTSTWDRLTKDTQFVLKSADQSVTSSITLIDDTELTLPCVANASYIFDTYLMWVGNETGDIKFGFSFPVPGTFHFGGIGPNEADAGFNAGGTRGTGEWFARNNLSASPTSSIQYAGSTAVLTARIGGSLVTTSGTGSITLRWAQDTSNATATTVKKGSWMSLQRIA